MKRTIVTTLTILCSISIFFGQHKIKKIKKKSPPTVTQQNNIYYEILNVDSSFFHAFNTCDSVAYLQFLANDLEFYHDLGGLHYLPTEMQSLREMCAMNNHIRRKLLQPTLEVYKLGNFGAVEIGVHRIYHTNPNQPEHISGDYKFIHVWQKVDSAWKLKRIISYGHNHMNNH
jgi:ketosteroid isomerase-like protein